MNPLRTEQALVNFSQLSSPKDSLSISDTAGFNHDIHGKYGAIGGTLTFKDSPANEARKFLYVDHNIESSALRRFMIDQWKLESANIIIPVLSGITDRKPFKNPKMNESFINGIKSAANASEVWFLTNGLDTGLPQLIGTAFHDETDRRRADAAWDKQMDHDAKPCKPLVLIGIVCDQVIKHITSLIPLRDEFQMDVLVPPCESGQISLNRDHTHFIIIREQPIGLSSRGHTEGNWSTTDHGKRSTGSTQSQTNKFRDRFERFLHQETLQGQSPLPSPTETISSTARKTNPWGKDGFPMVYTLLPTSKYISRGTNFAKKVLRKHLIRENKFVNQMTITTFVSEMFEEYRDILYIDLIIADELPVIIEALYRKIHQGFPVVIVKGTGSVADIIAFVHEEINAKNDREHEDNHLKVEIARRLLDQYPDLKKDHVKRNEIRDHIFLLVEKACEDKGKFLTFLDVNSTTASLNDFHQLILSALLQSQETDSPTAVNDQLKRNLLLTLDWNLPKLARSEIFQRDFVKYVIDEDLFDKAILGKDLEPFVDLFLDQKFILHSYLKWDKLKNLFDKAEEREFFTITSLEGILGLTGDNPKVSDEFVENDIDKIIEHLTRMSHFFNESEKDRRSGKVDVGNESAKDIQQQETMKDKQALRHLIIYAVLMHRQALAKVLWKHCSEPIPLALICCRMYKELAPYCYEPYQRSLVEKSAEEFSEYAVGVLDKAFNEDDRRACDMLDEKHANWNDITTIELAYKTKNKEFMAHAACQKWLTRKFYGNITPRELSWGLFRCPVCLKILCSAIFLFPMRFWINFSPIGQASLPLEKAISSSDDKNDSVRPETQLEEGEPSARHVSEVTTVRGCSIFQRIGRCFQRKKSKNAKSSNRCKACYEKFKSILKKIKTLWAAPITKFYTNFAFYIVFLFLFTLAVMWPSCGNRVLDCIVWLWAATIAVENARVAYAKHHSQINLPLRRIVTEVVLQIIFLVLYLVIRIVEFWLFGNCLILPAKTILAIGLIYYYYRILYIFFPFYSELGPWMIRLRYMVTRDFFTFLCLFVVFMISSGVAITAVLYPHHPIDSDLLAKAFVFRGLMALFTGEMRDVRDQNRSCIISETNSINNDNILAYNRYGISSPKCNQPSWVAWFLLIQYFFLAKRFLASLLTAMFSLTGARVQSQSKQIWMYDRYEIVMEYTKRPRLPPPFVIFSWIYMLIIKCSRLCISKSKKNVDKKTNPSMRSRSTINSHRSNDSNPTHVALLVSNPDDNSTVVNDSIIDINIDRPTVGHLVNCNPLRPETNMQNKSMKKNGEDDEVSLYWKYKAKEYSEKAQQPDRNEERLDRVSDDVMNSRKDINALRRSLREVNDRVITLEKLMTDSYILLQNIQAAIPHEDKLLSERQKFVHILARRSPYVYTSEARFLVTERYIPWKIPFHLYDPIVITLPKEHHSFRDDERPFVEQDLLKPNLQKKDENQLRSAMNSLSIPSTPVNQKGIFAILEQPVSTITSHSTEPVFNYKSKQVDGHSLSSGKKITLDQTTWITQSIDQNSVFESDLPLPIPLNPMGRTGVRGRGALIRWGSNKSIMTIITRWKKHNGEFVIIDGQRILEALAFKDKYTNDWKLPGGKIMGVESRYAIACRSFSKLVLQDDDTEHSWSLQEQDMIEYFRTLAHPDVSSAESDRFKSHMVYQGYIDDVRNTDNAWVEAEIWNFHYGSSISFPNDKIFWKDVTHDTSGFLVQTSILREIARIHYAYFE